MTENTLFRIYAARNDIGWTGTAQECFLSLAGDLGVEDDDKYAELLDAFHAAECALRKNPRGRGLSIKIVGTEAARLQLVG